MENILKEILYEIDTYVADSGIWILYLVSLLTILKINDEKGKAYILKPMLLVMLIIFNPIAAVILDKCLDSSYWRVIWLMQEVIVISYAIVIVLRRFQKVRKIALGVMIVLSIMLAGKNMYSSNELVLAENMYKIPDEMIELCQIIVDAENSPVVVAVDTIPIWLRQYDASIDMVYGRYGENELRALVNDANRDYEELHDILEEKKCNLVIFRVNEISNEEIYQYGFEYIGSTEHYVLYKVI